MVQEINPQEARRTEPQVADEVAAGRARTQEEWRQEFPYPGLKMRW